jgi:hypothetical protein
MDAFLRIGVEKSASLPVVAPAIGEALIATAFGLVAAIPATIGYNYVDKRIGDCSTSSARRPRLGRDPGTRTRARPPSYRAVASRDRGAVPSGRLGGGARFRDINVTPLVDVMLVLLIVFMVTAPLLTTGPAHRLARGEGSSDAGEGRASPDQRDQGREDPLR